MRRSSSLWAAPFPRQGALNCVRVERLSRASKHVIHSLCVLDFGLVCSDFPAVMDCNLKLLSQMNPLSRPFYFFLSEYFTIAAEIKPRHSLRKKLVTGAKDRWPLDRLLEGID